jgi:hypothetical protein
MAHDPPNLEESATKHPVLGMSQGGLLEYEFRRLQLVTGDQSIVDVALTSSTD